MFQSCALLKTAEYAVTYYLKMYVYLIFSTLELVQDSLRFGSDIQFSGVIHQENDVCSVDEPLARVIEGE